MKKYRVYQVDAFTTERFQGNPAGVIPNADGLTEKQVQDIARELNNSETAFVFQPTASDHDVWIRFFTPTMEVPSCGHATVSAHYVRAIENHLSSCRVIHKIGIGILPVEIVREENDYTIIMTQGRPEFSSPLMDERRHGILDALGLAEKDMDKRCPIQIVSTGHSKVMIGIQNRSKLNALTPDAKALTKMSKLIGCNGYFVFTLDSDTKEILTHGRMFAPAIGIAEDPVTGNANGPLGAYLVKHRIVRPESSPFFFKGQQGEAIGRLGTVDVTVHLEKGEPVQVQIAGRAVIAFHTEIEL